MARGTRADLPVHPRTLALCCVLLGAVVLVRVLVLLLLLLLLLLLVLGGRRRVTVIAFQYGPPIQEVLVLVSARTFPRQFSAQRA